MATTAAVLDILVRANSTGAVAGLKKTENQLQRTDRQTKKTEGRFTSLSRVGNRSFSLLATGAKAGGLAIGAGLVVGLKKANDEAREAAKVSRQTAAVLKSTGGAANITTKEIEGLANSIALKSGMDDEAIQSAENLLLTFTKVRNETGKQNQIFSRATSVITDMSVALDQDLKSSTIQVGKALNDPIKGITALQRVGVTFTAQQKEMVKGWVESGDTLKAQRFILAELRTEFGGSAAAQADGLDKAKAAANNLLEVIGGPINSALSTAGGAFANFAAQMQAGTGAGGRFRTVLVTAFNDVRSTLTGFVNSLNISKEDLRNFGQAASNVFTAVRAVARAVWPGISQMIRGVLNTISGIVKIWSGVLTLNFRQVWAGIRQIVFGSLQKIIGLIRASPIGQAATAAFNAVKKPASAAFGAVRSVVSSVFNAIKKIIGDVMAGILRRFATLFDVASKIPGIGGKFKSLADKARDAATDVDKLGENVKRLPANKRTNITVRVKWPKVLRDAIPGLKPGGGFGSGAGWPLSDALTGIVQRGAQARANKLDIGDFLGTTSPFGPLGTAKGSLGKYESIGHRMGLQTTSGYRPGDPGWHGKNRARDLSNGSGPTSQMMAYARFMAQNFGGKLLELIYTPLGFSIKNGKKVPPFAQADHYDHVHVAAQRGAMVPGSGSGDKVRALLEPGEGIINKKAVQAMGGRGVIEALNSAVPRFASGGTVARAAHAAGFRGNTLLRMVAEAKGESGWNERAVGDGGKSKGLWQIHTGWNPWAARLNLFDPFVNARAAMRIFRSQGVGAWHAEHGPHMGAAARAIASMGRAAPGRGRGRGRRPGRTPQQIARDRATDLRGRGVPPWNAGPGGKGIPLHPTVKGQSGGIFRFPRGTTPEEVAAEAGESGPSAAEVLAEAQKALAEEVKGLKSEVAKQNAFSASVAAVGLAQAHRALADMVSGQLGGMTAQRLQTAGDGRLARY